MYYAYLSLRLECFPEYAPVARIVFKADARTPGIAVVASPVVTSLPVVISLGSTTFPEAGGDDSEEKED